MDSAAIVARRLLANMPDDVFEIYIRPLIVSNGWPFTTVTEPTTHPWLGYFDYQTIETIAQLTWERREILFPLIRLHPDSKNRIKWIIGAHIFGLNTPCAGITNGKLRFQSCRDYIARNGRMPAPVILMREALRVRVLDGNHRLAALTSLRGNDRVMVDCWIGS